MTPKGSESEPSQIGPKSCDQCRRRKIRCDRDTPCSACVAAGLKCAISLKRHIREPRSRVLISDAYEKKMDSMDVRLKSMEKVLTQLAGSSSSPQASSSSVSRDTLPIRSQESSASPSNASNVPSGESLFKTQTMDARDFLERAVVQGLVRDLNPAVQLSIVNLRGLVDRESRRSSSEYDMQSSSSSTGQADSLKLDMAILTMAAPLLKTATDSEPSIFKYAISYASVDDFESLFQFYSASPDSCSFAQRTIVNIGLYFLFVEQEYNTIAAPTVLREYDRAAAACQRNLETAIKTLPLKLSPEVHNLQALLLLASYAIDACWPLVAWRLNSTAAALCKAGPYNQSSQGDDGLPVSYTKSNIFWQVYTLDKYLSLRLGCASVLEDMNVQFDLSAIPTVGSSRSTYLDQVALPQIRVTTGSLRARVYSQIYSPEASFTSPDERINKAMALAHECQILEKDIFAVQQRAATLAESSSSFEIANLLLMSSLVQFYSLTTLIYRVIPANNAFGAMGGFSENSLQSARQAIEHHLTCMTMLGSGQYLRKVYVHWTLMLTPFAPVFVLFCHALETLDSNGLETLQKFTHSLRHLTGATEVAGRMYLLCQGMCDVLQACLDDARQNQEQAGFDAAFATLNQAGLDFISHGLEGTEPLEPVDFYFGNISLP